MIFQMRGICTKRCVCHAKGHSHDIPHLPHNLHVVIAWRSPDNEIRKNTQHHTSKVLRLLPQNEHLHLQSAAPARKNTTHLLIALVTQNDFWHVMKGSVTPATRNETRFYATFGTSKSDHFCSSRCRHGHSVLIAVVLRTAADCCERASTPRPPKQNENPSLRIRGSWIKPESNDSLFQIRWKKEAS